MSENKISFGAIPISRTHIPVKKSGRWVAQEVSFVRFNPKLTNDMDTLKDVKAIWKGNNLSASIAEEAEIVKSPVYALVSQKENLKKILPENVLGLFTTDKIDKLTDTVEIYKLGVNPEFAYAQKRRSREVKHVGSTMIREFVEFIDKKFNVKSIVIGSEDDSVRFYQRMGIPERENSINVFEIKKDMFKTL